MHPIHTQSRKSRSCIFLVPMSFYHSPRSNQSYFWLLGNSFFPCPKFLLCHGLRLKVVLMFLPHAHLGFIFHFFKTILDWALKCKVSNSKHIIRYAELSKKI